MWKELIEKKIAGLVSATEQSAGQHNALVGALGEMKALLAEGTKAELEATEGATEAEVAN